MEADAVHAWLVPVETAERAASRYAPLLSPDERARSERYKSRMRAAQFVAGRAALRVVLGRVTGVAPADLRFTQNEWGKPALIHDGPPVHFNVAHSGEFALIAVTCAGPVGVDLEAVRPVKSREAIARRWFSEEDLARLQGVGGQGAGGTDGAFLRLWTRKEALVKAWGVGLSWRRARSFSVWQDRIGAASSPAEGAVAAQRGCKPEWTVRSWTPHPGYVAAVAAPGDSWRLVYEVWHRSPGGDER